MQINTTIDFSGLNKRIDNWQKKLAYAVSDGINETSKLIQKVERERASRTLNVRQQQFINRQIAIIKPFASPKKGVMYSELSVGQRTGLLLGKLEDGGYKTPLRGRSVAVPRTGGAARRTMRQPIDPGLTWKAMNMQKHTTKTGKTQWKGNNRTFIIGRSGVFQRVGSDKNDINLIYSFEENPHLRGILGFRRTANGVGNEWLDRNISAQLRRKGLI